MRERLARVWATTKRLVIGTAESYARNDLSQSAAALSFWLLVTAAPLALALFYAVGTIADLGAQLTQAMTGSVKPVNLDELDALADLVRAADAWASSYGPVVAFGMVLLGATGVFSQFAGTVARIWDEGRTRHPALVWIRHRLVGLTLLLVLAVLLVSVAVAGAAISSFEASLGDFAAESGLPFVEAIDGFDMRAAFEFVAYLLIMVVALSIIPSVRPRLRDIMPGAVLTSLAYMIGNVCLGWYFSTTSRFDAYGVFGAFIALLMWAYYNSLILLTGAAFAHETILVRSEAEEPAS